MGLCSSSSRGDCARDAMGRVCTVFCHKWCVMKYDVMDSNQPEKPLNAVP